MSDLLKRSLAAIVLISFLAAPVQAQGWSMPPMPSIPAMPTMPSMPSMPTPSAPTWSRSDAVVLPMPEERHETRESSWSRSQWKVRVWTPGPADWTLPAGAVEAGRDEDGKMTYVAVAEMSNGLLMPGKTKAPFTTCWAGFGGKEHLVGQFRIVAGPGYRWVDCGPGRLPANAVTVGRDQDGTRLYIARGEYMGRQVAGKYREGTNTCLVPFGGRERDCHRFQVLVRD